LPFPIDERRRGDRTRVPHHAHERGYRLQAAGRISYQRLLRPQLVPCCLMRNLFQAPILTMKNILSTWLLTIATAAVVHAQSGLGTALSFDGLDDKVEIGAAPVPAPWTAECWLNRQDSFDDSAILLGDAATALKMEQWPNTRRVGF